MVTKKLMRKANGYGESETIKERGKIETKKEGA